MSIHPFYICQFSQQNAKKNTCVSTGKKTASLKHSTDVSAPSARFSKYGTYIWDLCPYMYITRIVNQVLMTRVSNLLPTTFAKKRGKCLFLSFVGGRGQVQDLQKTGRCLFLYFLGGRGCKIGATGESGSFTSCFHVFSLFFTEEKSMKEQISRIGSLWKTLMTNCRG